MGDSKFLLILILFGILFHTLGYDSSFKLILGRCDSTLLMFHNDKLFVAACRESSLLQHQAGVPVSP